MEGVPKIQTLEKNNGEQEKIRQEIGNFFDASESKEEKIDKILLKLRKVIEAGILDGEKTTKEIKKCLEIGDREEFINRMVEILEPFFKMQRTNPGLTEQLQRESFVEQGGFIPLNEILSYGGSGSVAHIHFAPSSELLKEMGTKGFVELVTDGFKKLAEVVKNNEKIKLITATSWIVAKHPGLLQRFGFKIVGPISQETRDRHFKNDKRDISEAQITREELLEKYFNTI